MRFQVGDHVSVVTEFGLYNDSIHEGDTGKVFVFLMKDSFKKSVYYRYLKDQEEIIEELNEIKSDEVNSFLGI